MAIPPLTFLALTLTSFGLEGVFSTIYTKREHQRLLHRPLMSVTFDGGQGSLGRCIMACRSNKGCFSVNVHMDQSTSAMTCALLGVYLHEAIDSLISAPAWTFIQEDPVYTDTPWALAFRASSAVNLSVWDTWQQEGRHDDPSEAEGCTLPTSSLPCLTHFRSYVLDHWSNIDQVRLSLHNDTAVVAQVIFDGRGTSRLTWMNLTRILTSTWTDLSPASTANFFSVEGAGHDFRRFFMNAYYDSCPRDSGWILVADVIPGSDGRGPCGWENTQPTRPTLLYSPLLTATVWANTFGMADFMMVHVTFVGTEDYDT